MNSFISASQSAGRRAAACCVAGTLLILAARAEEAPACFVTEVDPYAVSLVPELVLQPILSSGDVVPRTSDPSKGFMMVGIPDGLGGHQNPASGTVTVYMNHELGSPTTRSAPLVGDSELLGAFVSKFELSDEACVISGDVAYRSIRDGERNVTLPLPTVANGGRGFARFCSGSLAWREAGFDRPVYMCGEESGGAGTYDGKGGLQVFVIDNVLYTAPWLGRFPWENCLAQPKAGAKTVLLMMEDGPSSPDSQLYMWVGTKTRRNSSGVLDRNGLGRNGRFYVFASDTAGMTNEVAFQSGSLNGRWVEITGVESMTDVQLEAASDAVGAFGFIRPEDGAFDKRDPNGYFFVTTGGAAGNQLGRLYNLHLNPANPAGPCTLSMIYNADAIIAAGGDIALSPDNIDATVDALYICEDGTTQSRAVMASKGRDGRIWRLDLNDDFSATPVVELNPPGRDGTAVGPGVWETSGVIDGSSLFGHGTLLFDVQAHGPTSAPAAGTVEDGQLLIARPATLEE